MQLLGGFHLLDAVTSNGTQTVALTPAFLASKKGLSNLLHSPIWSCQYCECKKYLPEGNHHANRRQFAKEWASLFRHPQTSQTSYLEVTGNWRFLTRKYLPRLLFAGHAALVLATFAVFFASSNLKSVFNASRFSSIYSCPS